MLFGTKKKPKVSNKKSLKRLYLKKIKLYQFKQIEIKASRKLVMN